MKKWIAVFLCVTMLAGLTACQGGQGENKYQVGVCQLSPHPALDAATEGFVQALKDQLGEDKVDIDIQLAAGDSASCTPIINTFVSNNVDLIMANATPALQAAAAGTAEIPILGTAVTEYGVALEIENFNGTVGGNISGTADLAPLDQQAAMVKEWFPDAKNVGLLYCSAEPNSQYQVDTIQKELEKMGITCQQYSFADTNDIQAVTQKAANDSDVIYVPTDNAVANAAGTIDGVCRPAGVPVIAGEAGICKGCGVATLSISYFDLGYTTGNMAAKILKGEAKVSEMPITYADKVSPLYNQEICDDLKIQVPEGYEPIAEK